MNAILESGFSPPPRILRRPHGRARTGLPCRTIDLCIALDERPAGCIEVGVDAGLRPQIEASRTINPTRKTTRGAPSRARRPRCGGRYRARSSNADG